MAEYRTMSAPCWRGVAEHRAQEGVVDRQRHGVGRPCGTGRHLGAHGDVDEELVGLAGVSMRNTPGGPPVGRQWPLRGLSAVAEQSNPEDVDAELGKDVLDQVVGAPVDRFTGHQQVAGTEVGEQGRGDGRHAGLEESGVLGAVPQGEPVFGDLDVGVVEPAVDQARLLPLGRLDLAEGDLEEVLCPLRRSGTRRSRSGRSGS